MSAVKVLPGGIQIGNGHIAGAAYITDAVVIRLHDKGAGRSEEIGGDRRRAQGAALRAKKAGKGRGRGRIKHGGSRGKSKADSPKRRRIS